MSLVWQTSYWFLMALVLALLEIEIEGAHGWAERTATWYRTRGLGARVWALFAIKKPLTGYHLALGSFVLLLFHLSLITRGGWSWAAEADTISLLLLWTVAWDFLWFLFNPAYGWTRFRPGLVWWHRYWLGRFPLDYWVGVFLSFLVAGVGVLAGNAGGLRQHGLRLGVFLLLTFFAAACTPWYRRAYAALRQRDDRPAQPPA